MAMIDATPRVITVEPAQQDLHDIAIKVMHRHNLTLQSLRDRDVTRYQALEEVKRRPDETIAKVIMADPRADEMLAEDARRWAFMSGTSPMQNLQRLAALAVMNWLERVCHYTHDCNECGYLSTMQSQPGSFGAGTIRLEALYCTKKREVTIRFGNGVLEKITSDRPEDGDRDPHIAAAWRLFAEQYTELPAS